VLDRLISTMFGWLMLVRWVGTGKKHFSHCKRLGCKGSEVVWSGSKRGAKWIAEDQLLQQLPYITY
jgi:hypothetical protein